MNSRQFLEGECGRSNPLVGLASHATQDNAFQDMTNIQSASNESSVVPQTFRMEELMQQIQNINVVPEKSWIDENANQFNPSSTSWSSTTTQEPNWFIANEPLPQLENRHQLHNSQEFFRPPLEFAHNEAHPINNLHSAEEYRKQQKEIEDSIKEFLELDDNLEQLKENIDTKEPEEETNLIYFDGIGTEDVHKATTPDILRSKGEHFCRFLKNYIKKFQDRDFDVLHHEKEYDISPEKNPFIGEIVPDFYKDLFLSHELNKTPVEIKRNIDFPIFDSGGGQSPLNWSDAPKDLERTINLMYTLEHGGQYYDSYSVAKQSLHLDPNYFSRYIYHFLFDEQYYYQGCQVILNWLRNHPDYQDIVPPSYKMKDKSSNLVEKEEIAELQKMLIRAAQRHPVEPDYNVQVALSKLLEISHEYDKSSECMLAMAKSNVMYHESAWFQVGLNFLRSNEPGKALEAGNRLMSLPSSVAQRDEFRGQVYLYLKDYERAGQHFLVALNFLLGCALSGEIHSEKMDTIWTQLRLCAELMRRPDLLALVEKQNVTKLREEFNYDHFYRHILYD